MNGKQFWIQIWDEKMKQPKRNNNSKALSFLETWELNDPSNALNELIEGTNAYKAGKWGSAYVVQIPNGDKEAIRNRWSNHPSKETEWPSKEIEGLPNRRYSIYIYDKNTVPEFANIAETKWKSYYSEGIPVYEKGFNVAFLRKTFPKLKNILLMIYKGGVPQPDKLPIKIVESTKKQNTNMKTENRNRNVVRLTESKLKQIIAEELKKALKETGNPGSLIHGTHRREDLIPVFMSEIFRNNPQKAREIWKSSPNLLQALCDKQAGINTNWWDSEEAMYICDELQDALQEYAPEGHYFGTHMGDGSDFGYWNDEN